MLLTSLFALGLASLAPLVSAQDDTQGPIRYDVAHNATTIYGTWSTGSQAVLTGEGFCDPAKLTFNYPKNTGVSYSFSEDGFYEIARYRFNANGSDPTCITGVIGWVHGRYSLNANGSITMVPFGDGFQQVQDPCAAISNFIETYNHTEYYKGWRIFQDPQFGPKLHLFQFDGAPVAPMFLNSKEPNMFPTQPLRNTTTFVHVSRREVEEEKDESGALVVQQPHLLGALGGVATLIVAAVSLL